MRGSYLVLVVCEIGIKGNRLLEHLNRLFMPIQLLIGLPELKIRIWIIRLDGRSFHQGRYCKIPFPLVDINNAEIIVGKELIGVCRHLNLKFFHCLADFALSLIEEIGNTEIIVGARELWIESNRPFELLCRLW